MSRLIDWLIDSKLWLSFLQFWKKYLFILLRWIWNHTSKDTRGASIRPSMPSISWKISRWTWNISHRCNEIWELWRLQKIFESVAGDSSPSRRGDWTDEAGHRVWNHAARMQPRTDDSTSGRNGVELCRGMSIFHSNCTIKYEQRCVFYCQIYLT